MADETRVHRVSFSLEPKYHKLLKLFAKNGQRSMTHELRMMLDERARAEGLTPINATTNAAMERELA